jgi:hypothetical protein
MQHLALLGIWVLSTHARRHASRLHSIEASFSPKSMLLAHAHACMPPPSSSCYSSRVQAKTRRQAEVAVGPIPIRGARTEIEPAMRSRTRWSVTRPGTGEPHGRRTAGRLVVVRQGPSFFPADLFVRPSVSDHWDLGYLLRFA